jgi:hypothetical protein
MTDSKALATVETDNTTPTVAERAVQNVSAHDNVILFHAAGIKTAWNKQVSGIIETGQLLLKAKKEMSGTGRWLKLFDKKIGDLPFGEDTAVLLMKIARHKVLSDSEHVRNLPPHWGTLAVLSKATPRQLEKWLADGTVNAETERKRAESLISPKPAKAKAKKATADSDNTAPSEIDPDTIAFNNTASNGDICSRCLEQLHLLLCDSRIDWEKVIETVGIEKIQEIIEELKSKLADHADTMSREREWREAEAAKLPTPPDAN